MYMGEIKVFGFSKNNFHIFGDLKSLYLQLLKYYIDNRNIFLVQFYGQSQNLPIIIYIWGYMSGNLCVHFQKLEK